MTTLKLKYVPKLPMKAGPKASGPVASFILTDDPGKPGNFIVNGSNAAGDVLDISAVATIGVVSSDPATATVATTGAATFAVQGVKPTVAGTPLTVTITATWTDGSVGPFTATANFTINPGPANSLVVSAVP